jgi:hypothetical protein
MNIENDKVYFINYGKLTSSDYTRLVVLGDKVEKVYEILKHNLSSGHYISINQTYECFNGWLEQGDCIRYKNL